MIRELPVDEPHSVTCVDEETHVCICGWVHVGSFGVGMLAVIEHYDSAAWTRIVRSES